jgi:hypothetical protein
MLLRRVILGVRLSSRQLLLFAALSIMGLGGSSARADRAISAFEVFDRVRGMWLGQLIGNAAGRASEGLYSSSSPNSAEAVDWQIKQAWDADDDTDIEYIVFHTRFVHGFDYTAFELADEWTTHLAADGIYVANKQAWRLMLDGHTPPETGSRTYNQHWYSIDSQICTEVLGAVSPGLPQAAIDLAGKFGRITNDGFAVTPTASVPRFNAKLDRNNLLSIVDGVTDNSYDGHKPYYTYVSDVNKRPETDWYELSFSEEGRFSGLTFHEGDVVWSKLNTYYREDEPLGGYFENLTVQIRHDGHYSEPADLTVSEDLDRFRMYQEIRFRFTPTVGDAIRIVGTPGGSKRFTTILELEVEGDLCEDPNATTIDPTDQ